MALFTTAYFPCISYIRTFINDDNPIIEVCDSYRKQTYRNRCKVLTSNGIQTLSVPVVRSHNHTITQEIRISYDEPWQQIHRRCLESAYRSAPYFEHYYSRISPLFERRYDSLVELNDSIMTIILKSLKQDVSITHSTSYERFVSCDYREAFNAKEVVTGSDIKPYYQVFGERFGFVSDLSILDLLFNEGPESVKWLR